MSIDGRDVFGVLYRCKCRWEEGIEPSEDYALAQYGDSQHRSFCRLVSEYAVDKSDVHFLGLLSELRVVLGHGDFWVNAEKICSGKSPRRVRRRLYYLRDAEEKALKKHMSDTGLNFGAMYRTQETGRSIMLDLLDSGAITPWCYVAHLDMADGSFNKDEVRTNQLLQELTR